MPPLPPLGHSEALPDVYAEQGRLMYGSGDPVCAFRREGFCWYPKRLYLKDAAAHPGWWGEETDAFDVPGTSADWEIVRYIPTKRSGGCPFSDAVVAASCPFHSSRDPHLTSGGQSWVVFDTPGPFEMVAGDTVRVSGRVTLQSALSLAGQAIAVGVGGEFEAYASLPSLGRFEVILDADVPNVGRVQYRRVVERVESQSERLIRLESEERLFKTECRTMEYVVVEKDFLDLLGEKLCFTGQVTEIANLEAGGTRMTLAVTKPVGRASKWRDSIRIEYPAHLDVYRGDVVDVWGTLGFYKTSNRRDARSRPGLNARYVASHDQAPTTEAVGTEVPDRAVAKVHVPASDARIERERFDMDFWDGYETVVEQQQATWGALDRELYDLCRRMPGHERLDEVVAKVAIIGRGYATRIEAMVPAEGRQGAGSAVLQVARVLNDHHSDVDDWIGRLPASDEFDDQQIATVIELHGCLATLLRDELSRGKKQDAPKSFVSKYLHFHRAGVPIYDSYSEAALKPFRASALAAPAVEYDQELAYRSYWEHCLAFQAATNAARMSGLNPTVKELDAFLLSK